MSAPIQSPASARCIPSRDFSKQNVNAQEGDEFLEFIVTTDEIWLFPHIPESKQQSLLVRRRWWGARKIHDVVETAGGRLLWLGDTEAGSKTINVWTMPATVLKN